jgi:hypothetical protein
MNTTIQYSITELKRSIARSKNFDSLADVAERHLRQDLGSQTRIVSGPISTGGLNHVKKNLARLKWTTDTLALRYTMFDHIPFEDKIVELVREWRMRGGKGYCYDILDIFYSRIFETGYIVRAYFLPDWNSSTGSKWERQICRQLGIAIEDIPISFYESMPQIVVTE